MRYLLLLITMMVISLPAIAQSGLSLSANSFLLHSDLYNPALFVRQGTHIGFSLHADLYHSSLAYGKFTTKRNGQRILMISSLLNDLEDQNEFSANGSWDIFSIRFVGDQWKIGLDHGIRMNSTVEYPRELVELAVNGNEPFIGKTISFGPDFEYSLYHTTGIVLTYFKENWSGGLRLKWLNGLKYLHSKRSAASLHTDTSFYATTIFTDYLVQNSNVIQDKEDQLLPYSLNTYSSYPFFSKNTGWSIDAGIAGKFKNHWHYALSISDLGFIRWKNNVKILSSNKELYYDGEQINDVIQISRISIQGAVDTLTNILHLEEDQGAFTNHLAGHFRSMVRFTKIKNWSFTLHGLYSQMLIHPLVVGLQASHSFGGHLNLGINSSNHYKRFNLGFHLIYSAPRIDVFLFYDNVMQGLNPYQSNMTHLRIGATIHWDKPPPDV